MQELTPTSAWGGYMKFGPWNPSRSREQGSALVAALLVVLLIGGMSVTYLQLSLNKNRELQVSADAKRAFYMAEAGISEAYAGLMAGKSGNVGSDLLPARFGNGVFFVLAEDLGGGRTCLSSTGLCGTGRASISIVVAQQTSTIAAKGVFSQQELTLSAGAYVDAYDSRQGPYDVLSLLENGAKVGSNQNVNLAGLTARAPGAIVMGSAQPGPSGLVVRGTGSIVTGSTAPSPQTTQLPALEVPDVGAFSSIVYQRATPVLTLPAGQASLKCLQLKLAGHAVIVGPQTLVVDQLSLDPGTTLTIDASAGAVQIYVRDWLNLPAGAVLECTSTDPTRVSILCSAANTVDRNADGVVDAPVVLGATGRFYGMIYAPRAAVTIPAQMEVFGAVAARQVTLGPNAKVHFDQAFTASAGTSTATPTSLCWRMIELPPCALVRSRMDPLLQLQKLGVTPVAAPLAHVNRGVAVVTSIPLASWLRVTVP